MTKQPHVCILTSQYFDWGIYGGFGSMSRKLAESLVGIGYRVSVIVPGRQGQKPVETIGGVEIQSFSPRHVLEACRIIRASRADIFHSQDPTVLTYLAQRLHPRRTHLVTSRDPRELHDWWIEFLYATPMRRLLTPFNYLTESGLFVRQAVRRADGVFCPAHFLKEKVKRLYALSTLPTLLPNLIDVPTVLPQKSERPTMTFVARWDKRKRPWIFLELARQFPDYRFVAVGQGSASAEFGFDAELRRRFRDVPIWKCRASSIVSRAGAHAPDLVRHMDLREYGGARGASLDLSRSGGLWMPHYQSCRSRSIRHEVRQTSA